MFYSKTVYHCKIIKAYGVATTRVRTTINENIIITLLKLSQEQLKMNPATWRIENEGESQKRKNNKNITFKILS